MQVKMPIVLFVAERGQNLTTPVLVDDPSRNLLHNLQQMSTQPRIQLQQRPDMHLGHHDHMLGPEPANRRTESQHPVSLNDHIDIDHPGYNLSAIPIRLLHSGNPTGPLRAADTPDTRRHFPPINTTLKPPNDTRTTANRRQHSPS